MIATKEHLLSLSDYSFERTRRRVDGLSDVEYFWEPTPNCWTVRQLPDGRWEGDRAVPITGTGPFTTIAWRRSHLIHCYGAKRNAVWLNLESVTDQDSAPFTTDAVGGDPGRAPSSALDALAALDAAHASWRALLTAVSEESLSEPLGPEAGQYAGGQRAGFVFHMLDEFIHHGAEIGVLRDLYRAHHEQPERLVVALYDGDRDSVEAMLREDPAAIDRLKAQRPPLVLEAAETGRWQAIPILVELGFDADVSAGAGPLHHAAGAGRLEIVRLLVEHGADIDRRDPTWHSDPKGWAEFFKHRRVAGFLEQQAKTKT